MILERDPRDALGIPEQLVHVVIADDILMIPLPPNVLAVLNLVPLIPNEPVQRLDDGLEIEPLGRRLDPTLTFRTPIVVVRALEDEAQALGNESDLGRLAPTQQVKRDLAQSIVMAHVPHDLPPPCLRALEGSVTGEPLRTVPGGLWAAFEGLESVEARVLGRPDRVVQVELGGEVPFPVVGVLTADVVCV